MWPWGWKRSRPRRILRKTPFLHLLPQLPAIRIAQDLQLPAAIAGLSFHVYQSSALHQPSERDARQRRGAEVSCHLSGMPRSSGTCDKDGLSLHSSDGRVSQPSLNKHHHSRLCFSCARVPLGAVHGWCMDNARQHVCPTFVCRRALRIELLRIPGALDHWRSWQAHVLSNLWHVSLHAGR